MTQMLSSLYSHSSLSILNNFPCCSRMYKIVPNVSYRVWPDSTYKNHSHNKVCLVNSVNEFLVAQGNEFYEVEAIAQP